MEPDQSPGFDEDSNLTGLSGTKRVCEGSRSVDNFGNSDVIKKVRVSEKVDDDHERTGKLFSLPEYGRDPFTKGVVPLDLNLVSRVIGTRLKCKVGPLEGCLECNLGLHGGLEINKGNGDVVGCSSQTGRRRRYTRKEKGKEKADDFMSFFACK